MGGSKLQDVNAILFDLDNTLIDTKGADRQACEEVCQTLQNYGVRRSIAREIVDKFYEFIRARPQDPSNENGDVDSWRTMLWQHALGPKLANFSETLYQLWKDERMKRIQFTSELENQLVELRKHYKLGLITNGPSSAQWEKIHKVNAQSFFDAIIVSGDIHKEKPSPAIFEEMFRRLDVSSLECLMVGDRLETDIKGAIRSNCAASVLISSSEDPLDTMHPRPDFKVEHVRDLFDLLPERNRFVSLHSAKSLGFFHSLRDEAPSWGRKFEW